MIAVACGLIVACSADRGTTTPVVVRDSAGVVIVESSAPQWDLGAGITIDPAPILDLASVGEGPEHEFFSVVDAARLSDGTIAVAETRSGTIKFFTAVGEYEETVGRAGDGPGEFARLRSLDVFDGDALFVFDPRAQRVTIYDSRRRVSRIVPLAPQFLRAARPAGEDALLLVVGRPADMTDSDPGHVRTPGRVLRVTLEGNVADTLAETSGSESVSMEGGIVDARPLFGKNSYLAVRDDRFYLGHADALQFQIHGPDGRLERIVRVPTYDLTLDEALVGAEISTRLELNPSPRSRERIDKLPVPTVRPAYADLLVDALGFVWLAQHNGWFNNRIGDAPRVWEVFGPKGEWLGPVTIPARFQVFAIGSDYVLGLFRDDVDIERPQLLRLHRK